ncbi:MAG TPA: hypothetical protein VJG65_00760, partial [Patescibacteria group bacterium]|nr:hypothetical protein [Patescibacteria group bacterium]
GSAAMPAGATTTEIIFEQPYARTPVIVATLVDDAENEEDSFRPYKISSKSVNGFKIIMRKPMSRDVNFDWIALAVSSGGTNPPIVNEPLVNNNQPATNNESSSSNEPLAENNGGGSGSAEQTNTESENQELSDNQPTAEPEPTSSEQPLSESEIMPGSEVSLDSTNQPDVQLEVSETPVPQTSEPVVSEPAPADQPIASEPAPAETPTASASNETAASEPISPATEAAPSVEASTN